MAEKIKVPVSDLVKKRKKGYTEIAISQGEGKWVYEDLFEEKLKFVVALYKNRKRLGTKVHMIGFRDIKLEDGKILDGNPIRQNYSEANFVNYIRERGIEMTPKKDLASFLND